MARRASRRTATPRARLPASRSTARSRASGWATGRCRRISRRRCSGVHERMPDFWPSCGYRLLIAGADPLEARAAGLLFRVQKITLLEDGAVMAADDAVVEMHASGEAFGSLGELLARNRTPVRTVDLDVLDRGNADGYWERSERFDTAVSLNRGPPTLAALCRVLERWTAHFLGVTVRIETLRAIEDARWSWHVGLDAEAS